MLTYVLNVNVCFKCVCFVCALFSCFDNFLICIWSGPKMSNGRFFTRSLQKTIFCFLMRKQWNCSITRPHSNRPATSLSPLNTSKVSIWSRQRSISSRPSGNSLPWCISKLCREVSHVSSTPDLITPQPITGRISSVAPVTPPWCTCKARATLHRIVMLTWKS